MSTAQTARLVLADDVDPGAQVLAAAFADDPMVTWLLHGTTHHENHREAHDLGIEMGFFRPSLDIGRRRGHSYVVEGQGGLRGVAVWAPPDTTVFDEASTATLVGAMSEHLPPQTLERMGALADLCRSRHPQDRPHFYLYLLGAMPQGHGWGGPLLTPVLARCDTDRLGAYLESSNARNHAFYERHGFRLVWQAQPDDHGPVMTGMWRDPQ